MGGYHPPGTGCCPPPPPGQEPGSLGQLPSALCQRAPGSWLWVVARSSPRLAGRPGSLFLQVLENPSLSSPQDASCPEGPPPRLAPVLTQSRLTLSSLAWPPGTPGSPGRRQLGLWRNRGSGTWWPCPNPLASLGLHSLGQRAKNEECSQRDQAGRSLETRAPPAVFPQPASGRQGSGADEFVEQTDNSW